MEQDKGETRIEKIKSQRTHQKLQLILIYWGLCKVGELHSGNKKKFFTEKLPLFHNENFPNNVALTDVVITKGFTSLYGNSPEMSTTFSMALDSMEAYFLKHLPESIVMDYSDSSPLEKVLKELLKPEDFRDYIKIQKFYDLGSKVKEWYGTANINPLEPEKENPDPLGADEQKKPKNPSNHKIKYIFNPPLTWRSAFHLMLYEKKIYIMLLGSIFIGMLSLTSYKIITSPKPQIQASALENDTVSFNQYDDDLPLLRLSAPEYGTYNLNDNLSWTTNIKIGVKNDLYADIHYHQTGNIPAHNVYFLLENPKLDIAFDSTTLIASIIIKDDKGIQTVKKGMAKIVIPNRGILKLDSLYAWSTGSRTFLTFPRKQAATELYDSGIFLADLFPDEEGDLIFHFVVSAN